MRKVSSIAALLAAASSASANLFYEGFNYSVGNLSEASPSYIGQTNPFGQTWAAAGSGTSDNITLTSPGLTGPAWLGGEGNRAEWAGSIGTGTGTNNASRIEVGPFISPPTSTVTVYYSLLLQITDVTTVSPNTALVGTIIGGFNTVHGPQAGAPSVIGTRLLVKQADQTTDPGKIIIGMSKNSSTGANVAFYGTPIDTTTGPVFIVGSYTLQGGLGNLTDDVAKMWVGPSSTLWGTAAEPAADLDTSNGAQYGAPGGDLSTGQIESFVLRQSGPPGTGATNTGTIVDEIRIGTSWDEVAPGSPTDSNDVTGNWTAPTTWTGGTAPNGAGKVANLTGTTAQTITMDANQTIGTLDLRNSAGHTINGTSTLTFTGTSINVYNGTNVISAPVSATGNLNVNVGAGKSLSISSLSLPSTGRVIKAGYGNLTVNNIRTSQLWIHGGKLSIAPNGTTNGTSKVDQLQIPAWTAANLAGTDNAPYGTLDLNNNYLIVGGGADPVATLANIKALIVQGRNVPVGGLADGTWDGRGIASGVANAAYTSDGFETRQIGFALNSALPFGEVTSFGGLSVTSNDILVRYTRAGDADLDGKCGDADATLIGLFYDNGATTGHTWAEGDFNYDGLIDDSDATALGLFYDESATPLSSAELTSKYGASFAAAFEAGQAMRAALAVPEPTSLSVIALGAFGLIRRRGRTRH
jgi:hypothetical protein